MILYADRRSALPVMHGIIPQTGERNKSFFHINAVFHPLFCAVNTNLRKRIELAAHS